MAQRRARVRVRNWGLAGLALLLLVAVAAALPEGFALSRRTGAVKVFTPDLPPVAAYLIMAIAGVVLATSVMLRLTGRTTGRREQRKPLPVLVQVAIVLLALFLPALVFGPRRLLDRPDPIDRVEREEPASRENAVAREPSQGLGVALTLLLALLFLALTAGVAWLFWPERRDDAPAPPQRDALLEGLSAGIGDLEAIADPRAAVIACYARLEALLASAGVARRPADTPLELLERALVALGAAAGSAAALTELFQRARFSDHAIDESMRSRALEALRDIRAQVGATV